MRVEGEEDKARRSVLLERLLPILVLSLVSKTISVEGLNDKQHLKKDEATVALLVLDRVYGL